MKEKKTFFNLVKIIFLIIFLGMFVFCLSKVVKIYSEYKRGTDAYEEAFSYITIKDSADKKQEEVQIASEGERKEKSTQARPQGTGGSSDTEESLEETSEAVKKEEIIKVQRPESVDFAALQAINPDIIGWIYVDGTRISYPITQGQDNSFYMNHMYNMQENGAGSIFMDVYNSRDLQNKNTVIYGHNMNNGSMFHDLRNFKSQSFYDSFHTADIFTPEGHHTVTFFAGYVASVEDDPWKMYFEEGEFEPWINEQIGRSLFTSGIIPTAEDRIVTLSTCSYEFDNARFVVLGILQ